MAKDYAHTGLRFAVGRHTEYAWELKARLAFSMHVLMWADVV